MNEETQRLEPIEYHQVQESLPQKWKGKNNKASKPIDPEWKRSKLFYGVNVRDMFKEAHKLNTHSQHVTNSAQGACGSFDLPLKAFKNMMSQGIRQRIIQYTNEYGNLNDKNWEDVDEDDLFDFTAVLFVASL